MANSFTTGRSLVYGTVDTTGASDSIEVTGSKLVDLSLDFTSGSFSGTVLLQRKTRTGAASAMDWKTIASYTGDTEVTFRSATSRDYRINVTVSSGTLRFELAAGNKD